MNDYTATTGYKGFHKGMICRGKQYAQNAMFEEPEANIGENGIHFCNNPFDVLIHHGFMDRNGELNEFAPVQAFGEVKTGNQRDFYAKKLSIGAKLSFYEFIEACVKFVTEKKVVAQTVSKISSKKIDAKVSSKKDSTTVASTGYASKVSSMGIGSTVSSTGDESTVVSAGDNSEVASAGDESTVVSTGSDSNVASTGRCSKIVSTGSDSNVASTGDESTVISMGNTSTVVSEGDKSTAVSTGYNSAVVSTRDKSTIISTGGGTTVVSKGDDCIICCVGGGSCVKAKRGSWITLIEWKYDEQRRDNIPILKTEYVDGERIKADVFYRLKDGEFQEVEKHERFERKILGFDLGFER